MNPRKLVTGLVAAVVLIGAYLLLSGGGDEYTIKAELQDAAGVRKNSSVKIAGVPGGTVKKLEITPRDTAIVTMAMNEDAVPIGKDASIEIRPTDLLGERYVALDAGNVDDPAEEGFTIAKSRTKLPVELDDVVNTFDGGTRERIKILVNEFGIALGGRGKDLAKLLDAMPPSLRDARQLVGEVTRESGALKALLARGDALTATVEPKKDRLASLVVQADTTLKALADRREKLGRTLDAAPGGLSALNTTLTELRRASTDLRPAAVDLRRTTQPLKDTLEALPGFEQSARESLKAAQKAAPALTKIGKKATGPLRALTPTLANVERFSSDLRPTLDKFDERAFEDALWMAQNIGGTGLKSRDALGHQLGANFAVNPETVQPILASLLNNPTPGGTTPDGPPPKSKPTTKAEPSNAASAAAPPTSAAPSASAPSATTNDPASRAPDNDLLGDLVDGVSGLLGGNAGTNSKPGAPKGLPGLLDSLLAP